MINRTGPSCYNCRWCEIVNMNAKNSKDWEYECWFNPPTHDGFPSIKYPKEWYCSKWELSDYEREKLS